SRPGELQGLIAHLDAVRGEWEHYFVESSEGRANIHTELRSVPEPLYRLYSPQRGTHFYTTDSAEQLASVAFDGFVPEGTEGQFSPTREAGPAPVYRLFQPGLATHLYTTDPFEWEGAVTTGGFTPEGVIGYVFGSPLPGTVPIFRLYHTGL